MSASTQAYLILLATFLLVVIAWFASHPQPRATAPYSVQPLATNLKINVNQDDAATLSLLPGIGPGIAEHIIEARHHGAVFHSPQDLEEVKFIGPKTIQRIDSWVTYSTSK